jgi:hypothetical protein
MSRYRYHIHLWTRTGALLVSVWEGDRVVDVQVYQPGQPGDALLVDIASWEEGLGLGYAAGRPVTWAEACAQEVTR